MCTASCITIDAEMYGITFSAKMLKRQGAAREHVEHVHDAAALLLHHGKHGIGLTPGTGT